MKKNRVSKPSEKASRRRPQAKSKSHAAHEKSGRRRGLWKGSLVFGLVNIPIYLESAEQDRKLHFHLIDKSDHAPVGYRQINKSTGKEISRKNIIKGFEYEKGQYVFMSEADFKKANVKATNSVEIEDFVSLSEIDPMLFERPYYVLPQKGGEKSYVLLRDVLKRTEKAAVAKIVLHTVQHLVAVMAREDYIILEIMRFANEVLEVHEADFLDPAVAEVHASAKEMAVAEQLVVGMAAKWDPEKYKNSYRDDLLKLIHSKVKSGKTEEIDSVVPSNDDEQDTSNVIDLTALLKKSLAERPKSKRSHGSGRA